MNILVLYSFVYILSGIVAGKDIRENSNVMVKQIERHLESNENNITMKIPDNNNSSNAISESNEGKKSTYYTDDRFLSEEYVINKLAIMTKNTAKGNDNADEIEVPPMDTPAYPKISSRISIEIKANLRNNIPKQGYEISSQKLRNDTGVIKVGVHNCTSEENELTRQICEIFHNGYQNTGTNEDTLKNEHSFPNYESNSSHERSYPHNKYSLNTTLETNEDDYIIGTSKEDTITELPSDTIFFKYINMWDGDNMQPEPEVITFLNTTLKTSDVQQVKFSSSLPENSTELTDFSKSENQTPSTYPPASASPAEIPLMLSSNILPNNPVNNTQTNNTTETIKLEMIVILIIIIVFY